MNGIITSASNQRIQHLVSLQSKSRERKRQNLVVIEGFREISRALHTGIIFREVYYCSDIDVRNELSKLRTQFPDNVDFFEVSVPVYQKVAYRETSDGIVGIAVPRYLFLDDLKLSANPLVLIVESIEKPGNLGALLRTADAAGMDAVIVCDPMADLYNPNVIRNSLGGLFSTQVVVCSSQEAWDWLQHRGIKSYAAALTSEALPYVSCDYKVPVAIIMGSEAYGLSKFWLENSDKHILIPMLGLVDSLNVSASAAILMYEAVRQRMDVRQH